LLREEKEGERKENARELSKYKKREKNSS